MRWFSIRDYLGRKSSGSCSVLIVCFRGRLGSAIFGS